MTVLVTGGTGSLGINIVRYLAKEGHCVVCFARRAGQPDPVRDVFLREVRDRIIFAGGDAACLGDVGGLVRRHRPTHVVHAAAITPTPEMERSMGRAVVAANVMGTINVLDASIQAGVERIVYISSAAVYGETDEQLPVDEDAPLAGDGLYAITKQAAERLCARYERLHGVPIVCARVGWAYGPMERPMAGSREQMSLVYECVRLAVRGEEIRLPELDAVRDWIYAGDLARAVASLLAAPALPRRTYNCAGPRGYTHAELLDTLGRVIPLRYRRAENPEAANVSSALTRRRRGPLSTERLTADTSYRPDVDLETGLRLYVEGIRDIAR